MAEIRKSSTSLSSQMTVLEEGKNVARPSSGAGAVKRTTKKVPSEGLIVLSPEPGPVQFDDTVVRPGSGGSRPGSRVGSAGRIEKKLQQTRKQELSQEEPRRSSAGARLSNNTSSHSTEPLSVTKLCLAGEVKRKPKNGPLTNKETRQDSETDSSDTSSDSDSSGTEETEGARASQSSHTGAPVELKGEFLKCIMDEDYGKAQELCKEILLLEPDNATCREFHSVIHEKIKQDEEEEGDDEEDDDDDDDDDNEESEDSDEDEEGSDDEDEDSEDEDEEESESDEDDPLPPGPINLLMGGLPVRPQQR